MMRYLVLLSALLVNVSCAGGLNEKQKAVDYVLAQEECGLDHGYICRSTAESDFLSAEADQNMVSGNYLKAWQIAFEDFQAIDDLAAEQKQLRHYKIGFSENPEQYVVHFQALLLPNIEDGKASGVIRATLGRTTRYWINKASLTIDRKLFYKD